MAYGHKFYSSGPGAGCGLIPDDTKEVGLSLLAFSRDSTDSTDIVVTVRSAGVDILAYMTAREAIQMAGRLRRMAIEAFEAEAG